MSEDDADEDCARSEADNNLPLWAELAVFAVGVTGVVLTAPWVVWMLGFYWDWCRHVQGFR